VLKFCEELHTGVWERESSWERERGIAAGGPQHDWWVWNNRPPSCVLHQTHSSHLTLSLSPTRSLCGCKQRPLGTWFLCDGQKDLSHLWQEYPPVLPRPGFHIIRSSKTENDLWFWQDCIWSDCVQFSLGLNYKIENMIHVYNCRRYYANKVPVLKFSIEVSRTGIACTLRHEDCTKPSFKGSSSRHRGDLKEESPRLVYSWGFWNNRESDFKIWDFELLKHELSRCLGFRIDSTRSWNAI